MNLKNSAKAAGNRSYYAFPVLITLLVTISSCQKSSVDPVKSSSAAITVGTTDDLSSRHKKNTTYTFSAPITLNGASNLTIRGDSIVAGAGPAICLSNCSNIHITKSRLLNGTNVNAVGISLFNCTNITVDSCYITNVASGVYAINSTGVVVNFNQMQNMLGPFPRGQFVQFNGVKGAGNKVTNNKFQNIMGQSYPEDAISMYETNGTAQSPVMISGNSIKGGGPSNTGGGIMLGDSGGSYQIAENNTLVNPGQYGMAVSGGTNMQIQNNQIYAAKNTFTNVGIYVDNQNTSSCSIIIVNSNKVNWTNSNGVVNGGWNAYNCGTVSEWSTNTWSAATLTASLLPTSIITSK